MSHNKIFLIKSLCWSGLLLSSTWLVGCGGGDPETTTATASSATPVLGQTPVQRNSLLNKTNITLCADQTRNDLPCNAQALSDLYPLKQDAEVQVGLTPSYTIVQRNQAGCIQDQNSGLVWELKTQDGGLRDVEYGYYWYEPDLRKNGGFAGFEEFFDLGLAPGETCGNHLENCNTAAYLAKLNQQQYCGYSDWRLPTTSELANLVDYGKASPPFVLSPFVVTSDGPYWSASPAASNREFAKVIYFLNGRMTLNEKFYPSSVIAVRGEAIRR